MDLCGIDVPPTVEGMSFAPYLLGRGDEPEKAAMIQCMHPFGEFERRNGGKEYRGIRTKRYTYVIDRQKPWLLYDNVEDPYQEALKKESGEYTRVIV